MEREREWKRVSDSCHPPISNPSPSPLPFSIIIQKKKKKKKKKIKPQVQKNTQSMDFQEHSRSCNICEERLITISMLTEVIYILIICGGVQVVLSRNTLDSTATGRLDMCSEKNKKLKKKKKKYKIQNKKREKGRRAEEKKEKKTKVRSLQQGSALHSADKGS